MPLGVRTCAVAVYNTDDVAMLRKGYKFRIDPTTAQAPGFVRMAGARRWVWNWALDRRIQHYVAHKTTLSVTALCAEITELKRRPATAWLREIDSQALQQAIRDLDGAFQSFFARRARFPRFKSKKTDPLRFRVPQRVQVKNGRVYVPKIGWVRMRQSRPIEGLPKSATFKRDPLGRWFICLVTEFELPDIPPPPADPERVVGADAGLTDFLVLSDGTRISAPRFFRKGEQKLRRAQRHLSRCQRGSRRQGIARRRVALLHQKIANRRRDFLHKASTTLTRQHDAICLDALSLRGLARTKLAKSVLDAGLGEFHRMLEYKARWYGTHAVVIDRWFPSSRLCGACGAIHDALTLSDRTWTCECGAQHDRDLNAARNIRTEGLRLLNVAVGHPET